MEGAPLGTPISYVELVEWGEYFLLKAEYEREALDRAQRDAGKS